MSVCKAHMCIMQGVVHTCVGGGHMHNAGGCLIPVHQYVCTSMWRPDDNFGCHPSPSTSTLFFEIGSLVEPGAHQLGKVGSLALPKLPLSLPLQRQGWREWCHYALLLLNGYRVRMELRPSCLHSKLLFQLSRFPSPPFCFYLTFFFLSSPTTVPMVPKAWYRDPLGRCARIKNLFFFL